MVTLQLYSTVDACNEFYDTYGHRSNVSCIINQMRKDCKNGGHPSLSDTAILTIGIRLVIIQLMS